MAKESTKDQVLKASKEIAVKFIEVGRVSPANFAENFKTIYDAIEATVRGENSAGADDTTDAGKK